MSDLATAEAPTATEAKAGTGKFFWYELMTSDQDAAIDYYTKVVGWTASDMPMPGDSGQRYTILNVGERGIGGVMQITDQMRAGGARPGWLGYIHVADADASGEEHRRGRRQGADGARRTSPRSAASRWSPIRAARAFYVMMPFPREAMPPLDPATPGVVSWHELYSSLGDKAAFDFYAGQFGWETMARDGHGADGHLPHLRRRRRADGRDDEQARQHPRLDLGLLYQRRRRSTPPPSGSRTMAARC